MPWHLIPASLPQRSGSFRLSSAIIESNQPNECLIGNTVLRTVKARRYECVLTFPEEHLLVV